MVREPDENAEQVEPDQAQDIADDARSAATDLSEDSERGGATDPADLIPQDTPDLVERMNEMVRSGHIDNDAFAGEPDMDDEETSLGSTEDMD